MPTPILNYLYNVITDKAEGFWSQVLKAILFILSWFYWGLIALVDLAYRLKLLKPAQVQARVISVGNITWGGTGKTSMIQFLAQFLLGQGKRVVILSRGYKQDERCKMPYFAKATKGRQDARSEYKAMGDEPYLLAQKFPGVPVIVGRDRIQSAGQAIKTYQPQVILLDDGFQHRRLQRDLDIVLVDVLDPFGNGFFIPRGSLREPKANLRRAQVIVLTNCEFEKDATEDVARELAAINSQALIARASYRFLRLTEAITGQTIVPTYLAGRPLCLMASIGNFNSFKKTVSSYLNGRVVLEFDFPDHYDYEKEDLDNVRNACVQQGLYAVITTEKDLVRLRPHLDENSGLKIFVLEVGLEITDKKEEFLKAVGDVCTD